MKKLETYEKEILRLAGNREISNLMYDIQFQLQLLPPSIYTSHKVCPLINWTRETIGYYESHDELAKETLVNLMDRDFQAFQSLAWSLYLALDAGVRV